MIFSIYGDSLSTYEGCNPEGYSVFYSRAQARRNGLRSAEDTWWSQVIRAFGGRLGVNNSYSGSRVTGDRFPAASSMERLRQLQTQGVPDVLLCSIGFNDFGYEVRIGKRHGWLQKPDPRVFADAYPLMLDRMKRLLPRTQVVCATLMRTCIVGRPDLKFPYDFGLGDPLSAFNETITAACARHRVPLADLAALDIVYETLDGSHATLKGHGMIAEGWQSELRRLADKGALRL